MILHDYVLSASCYKVRLLASLLGVKLTIQAVNFHPAREHKSAAFLDLNPAGTLPVLQDGDVILTQTAAILHYLAHLHGPQWLGHDTPVKAAQTEEWLAFAAGLNQSLGMARLHDVLGFEADIDSVRRAGVYQLRQLEARLADQRYDGFSFLTGATPTIADIACFPNVALAPDGGVSVDAYPSIRLWMRAIRSLPRFIEMPGIHRLHELAPMPHAVVPS